MSPTIQFIIATLVYFCAIVYLVYFTPFANSVIFLTSVGLTYAYMYVGQITNAGGLSYLALLIIFLVLFLTFSIFYGFVLAKGDHLKDQVFVQLFDTLDMSTGTNALQIQEKQITWYNPSTISFGMKVTNSNGLGCNYKIFEIYNTNESNNIFKCKLMIPLSSSDNSKCDPPNFSLIGIKTYNKNKYINIPTDINLADGKYHSFIFNFQGNLLDTYVDSNYIGQKEIGNPDFTISRDNVFIRFGSGLPITLANFKLEHSVSIPTNAVSPPVS